MLNIIRFQFAILFLTLLAYHSVTAQTTVHQIDSLMKLKHQAGQFNGTILVAIDGKVTYRQAFGFAEADRPLKVSTPFYLGSVSKQFTAMGIMMLVSKNKLSVDDKVIDYFPELPPFLGQITVRNLLNHTSGLPDYYSMGKYTDGMTNTMVFNIILDLKELDFPAGQQYAYSNTGYVLLSLLLERIANESFRQFLKREIFDPVGMKHTEVWDGTQPKIDARAVGHAETGEIDDYKAFTTGAGGIYSQLDDLFLWEQALYNESFFNHEILIQSYSPAILNNGEKSYYGFGWVLDPINPHVVQHSGSLVGFRTYLCRDMGKKNTLILLSNFSNDVAAIKEEILKLW